MRSLAVVVALMLLPVVVRAQQPPSTVSMLPPIGLLLGPIGLPPATQTVTIHTQPGPRRVEHPHRGRRHNPIWPLVVVAPPSEISGEWFERAAGQERTGTPVPVERRATGRLRVEVTPTDAQLMVDGLYVGTPADRNAIELDAGIRHLDVRAHGYEPVSVDVKIPAGDTITCRGALTPAATPGPVASPAGNAPNATIYLLPGCYVGDTPPVPAALPPRCDVRQLITYTVTGAGQSSGR